MSARATKSPQSRSWGKTSAGMNWTAWNSVVANALTNRPSDIPSRALPIASRTTAHLGPATLRSSRPNATTETSVTWTAAKRAKAIA